MCNQRQHFCLQQFVTVGKQLLLGGKQYKVYMHSDTQSKKERARSLEQDNLDSTRLSNLHFNLIFSIPRNVNKTPQTPSSHLQTLPSCQLRLRQRAASLAHQAERAVSRSANTSERSVCLSTVFLLGALLIESRICMSSGISIKAIAALNFYFNVVVNVNFDLDSSICT